MIGDLLSAKGITWAWYAGAWQAALDGKNAVPVPNFQYHLISPSTILPIWHPALWRAPSI
jgi:hypothetical protein